jgi:hypothetical protein
VAKGLRWLGVDEGRRKQSELDEKVLDARRWGEEESNERGVERRRWGCLL